MNAIKDKNIELNNYSNISDAINDYVGLIGDNFKSDVNISVTKEYLEYSELSQTIIFKKAKERFAKIGKSALVNNKETIYVSNSDIKERIAKAIRNREQKKLIELHLVVFRYLDKIIENGKLIAKAEETKGRFKYSDWNYYVTLIKLNGENYIIEFDTTLRNDGQRHFRLERIYSLKNAMKKTDYSDRDF